MSEQELNTQTTNEPQKDQKQQEEETVTLTKEEFNNLMSSIAELKSQVATTNQTIQKVAEPDEEEEEEQVSEDELANLSPKQVIDLITQNVAKQVGEPLLQMIMTLAVKDEIRECKSKYSDFDEYKDDIQQLAKENPKLTIEQAYKLAKANKIGTNPQPGLQKKKTKPVGEKGGVPRSVVSENKKLSPREAALKAIHELTNNSSEEE